jgi:uncharacterized membrane protein
MEANKIYKNVMILGIAGAVGALFNILLGWLGSICDLAVVAGFMGMYARLNDLIEKDAEDAASLKKLQLGALLYIVGLGVRMIPVIGWIAGPIVLIVAFVFMLLGYMALKKSETFPYKDAMGLPFIAAILGVVAAIFKIIPVVGTTIGNILLIATFVLLLVGWKKATGPVTE